MDKITILTCEGNENKATKVFSKREDGTIKKRSFDAGLYFTHEQRPVSSLADLSNLLETLLDPRKTKMFGGQSKETRYRTSNNKITPTYEKHLWP